MSNVRTDPSTEPPMISVGVTITDVTLSENVSIVCDEYIIQWLDICAINWRQNMCYEHRSSNSTWIGSTLWDRQSQTLIERSYPPETITEVSSLNFTEFTCPNRSRRERGGTYTILGNYYKVLILKTEGLHQIKTSLSWPRNLRITLPVQTSQ